MTVSEVVRMRVLHTSDVDIDELEPFQGDLKSLSETNFNKLRKVIIDEGFSFIVHVWQCDKIIYIIDGHQRVTVLKQMRKAGYEVPKIPCAFISAKTFSEAKKLVLMAVSQYGKLDKTGFHEFMEGESFDLEPFDFPDIDDDFLKQDLEESEQTENDDQVPDVIDNPYGVKHGDIWALGKHMLMCGDATSQDDVSKLMNGDKADLGFCDPPYNMGYSYNSYDDNKSHSEYIDFSEKWFRNLQENSIRQAITLGTKNIPIMSNLGDVAGVACWVKKNWITSCHISKLQQWEPIFFYGDFTKHKRTSDLFEVNRVVQQDVGDDHTCPKQIKLILDIFDHYGGETIVDLFQGSGTSIIACEKTNRKCYGMELDKHYCSVIIKRWEDFTNEKAMRV